MISNKNLLGIDINLQEESKESDSTTCVEANLQHADIPRERTRCLRLMEVVGADLQEYDTASYDGKKYLALYCEHKSGFTATVALKKKSEQPKHALSVINRMERIAQRPLEVLRADQGAEYIGVWF
jgi:hypothetical protein